MCLLGTEVRLNQPKKVKAAILCSQFSIPGWLVSDSDWLMIGSCLPRCETSFEFFQFCRNCRLISWISLPSRDSKLGASTMILSRYLFFKQSKLPLSSNFQRRGQHLNKKLISFISAKLLLDASNCSRLTREPNSLKLSKLLPDTFKTFRLFFLTKKKRIKLNWLGFDLIVRSVEKIKGLQIKQVEFVARIKVFRPTAVSGCPRWAPLGRLDFLSLRQV